MTTAIARRRKLKVVHGIKASEPITFSPRVQGIDSSVDELTLKGRSWRTEVGDAVTDLPVLERTIEGASTLTLTLHDPDRTLLRHPLLSEQYDVEIDGLRFRFVKLERQDAKTLTLTHEDREIARLRRHTGARKGYRDQMTRAEFALRLSREERPAIPFYCPQLHKRQPIGSSQEGVRNQDEKLLRREPGLSANANFTIKGVRADAAQIRNCDRVLDVGRSMEVPRKVLVGAIATGIPESLCRNLGGGDRDSQGFFQQRPSQGWGPPGDLERDARDYYRAAMRVYKGNPNISIPALCQAVQRSGNPGAYAQYLPEALKIVELYLGGTDNPLGSVEPASASNERYAFERKAKENTWRCHRRLAEEVNWRCFVSAGIEYFIAETDLLRSKVRTVVSDSAPGVEDISGWAYDLGKPITEITVKARVKAWAAPPGTVVDVEGQGPADGRYIVSAIRAKLGRKIASADITLKRPTPPLPEPVPEVSEVSRAPRRLSAREPSGAEGAIAKIAAEINRIDKLRLDYVWGGSHGSSPTPRNGPFDCSSFVSHLIQLVVPDFPTQATGTLISAGRAGPGRRFTIYVKNGGVGGGHTFVGIKVGGTWRYAGTSGSNPGGGPGWFEASPGYRAGFSQRHIGSL